MFLPIYLRLRILRHYCGQDVSGHEWRIEGTGSTGGKHERCPDGSTGLAWLAEECEAGGMGKAYETTTDAKADQRGNGKGYA